MKCQSYYRAKNENKHIIKLQFARYNDDVGDDQDDDDDDDDDDVDVDDD